MKLPLVEQALSPKAVGLSHNSGATILQAGISCVALGF